MAVSQTLSCRNCWLQLARRTKLHQHLPLCTWGGAFFLLSGDHKGIEKPNFCVCSITLLYPAVLLCLNKCFLSLLRLTCKPALSNIAALSAHEQKWRIFCKCGCLEGLLSGVVTKLEFTLKNIYLTPRGHKLLHFYALCFKNDSIWINVPFK